MMWRMGRVRVVKELNKGKGKRKGWVKDGGR